MRASGILLPISSLPTKGGIGGFSREAYDFVDLLSRAGARYWQILPLGPTGYGDSPYQAFSTYAGNPYFISLETLVEEKLLTEEERQVADAEDNPRYVDYGRVYNTRFKALRQAFSRFQPSPVFEQFVEENSFWLEDYCLFMAIKNDQGGKCWTDWPQALQMRDPKALEQARHDLADEIQFYRFMQYKFTGQWKKLKAYANMKGIEIIGDIPIYVAFDNADAWSNPELFQFDENHMPTAVAGCPPDDYAKNGQLWGNPLYRWDYHKKTGYAWWIQRIAYALNLYDVVRVDHFRGFDEYYAVPYGDPTAEFGEWKKGPGIDLFKAVEKKLGKTKMIAEDLGFVTPSVKKLVKDSGYASMKVLQFAFYDGSDSDYLPHKYGHNCVVYTGTHDNNTLMGWYDELSPADKDFTQRYMNIAQDSRDEIPWDFIRLAMSSKADLAIFPLQDVLGLGADCRLNCPSTLGENWKWRAQRGELRDYHIDRLMQMNRLYGRYHEVEVPVEFDALGELEENPAESEVIPAPLHDSSEIWEKEEELIRAEVAEDTESVDALEQRMDQMLCSRFGRGLKYSTKKEIFSVLMEITKEKMADRPRIIGKKKLYYISAEFLIGKLLSNNLINLGIFDKVESILKKYNLNIGEIEGMELEPSLGNGGLGRLAACFLDSIATLGLCGDGVGLHYHYGLFRQELTDHHQLELKNPWIAADTWAERQAESFSVPFRDFTLQSSMYDITVPGYGSGSNHLHLFDLDSVDDSMVGNDGIGFDKWDVKRNLTLFLYPDDSDRQGQLLRIYQQYFMVSNAAQLILKECGERGVDLHEMYNYVVIQINDTHPSMIIPELIRLLTERGFSMDEAIRVVSKTCAYTNHTILAEALEKWPIDYLEEVVPHLLPIIRELDSRAKAQYTQPEVAIIDDQNRVHMAHMDIHYGFSVNGVAALHTRILEKSELKAFYKLYPEKFNNKTNGITFRRWLLGANPELADYISELIGDDYKMNASALTALMDHADDEKVLAKLERIKYHNKKKLSRYLYETQNLDIDPHSIFDIQIKRLHEYKRQQLNALYAIYKYQQIKAGNLPKRPITMIFGAKAAPAYRIAKDIIHLILCLSDLISNDPEVAPYLRVVMVENYNVTKAEKLIPAADVSEQISLASKEASGTGNMKLMLNGAVTLGTEDGANVEIHQLVGDDNIYIFGKETADVIKLYANGTYDPKKYYMANKEIRAAVDFITSDELIGIGDAESLKRLQNELINKDWFMTLLDFEDYKDTKEKMFADYEDRRSWNRKALVNIAQAGYFSADRTIAQYNKDIWKL